MQSIARLRSFAGSARYRLVPAVTCLLAAVIVFDTTYLIVHSFSPLFYGDSWETVEDYKRFVEGHYGLSDLFAQHNEHRLAVPRLVFLTDFVLGRGLNIINQGATYLIQVLHAMLLIRIAAALAGGLRLAASAGVVLVLMLNFGQADNFIWGFQVQFVAVYAAATLAFWWFARALAGEGFAKAVLLVLSFGMALVSTYCMSNGFISTFVLVVLAIAGRASLALVTATLAFAIATALSYFYGFHLISAHSPPGYVAQHPKIFLQYLLAYLGGPLGKFGTIPATLLGALGAVLTASAAFRAVLCREPPPRLALFGVMILVAVTAAATAFGRAFFGVEQALESRYLTPVCAFWAAQFIYWSSLRPRAAPRVATFAVSLVTVIVLVGVVRAHDAMRGSAWWSYRQRNIQTDIILSGVHRPDLLVSNHPLPEKIERLARFLAERHLNIFALSTAGLRGRTIGTIGATFDGKACAGADAIAPSTHDPAGLSMAGWAWDVLAQRPAERVLIVDAGDRIVGFASGGWFWYRADRKTNKQVKSLDVGWRGFAASSEGPWSAYALLDNGRRLCRLQHAKPPANLDGGTKSPALIGLPALGAPIMMDRALEGGWAANGYPPGNAPTGVNVAAGSWSKGMGTAGSVTMGPFVSRSRTFAVPFVTGTATSGSTIEVDDAETDQVYARVRPDATSTWRALRFELPRDIAERTLIVKGVTSQAGPGTWLALGQPHALR